MNLTAIANPTGPRDLVSAIFLKAYNDMQYGNKKWQEDAEKFLSSSQAGEFARLIDLEPKHILRLIVQINRKLEMKTLFDDEYTGPRFTYGMIFRPASIGTVPDGRIVDSNKSSPDFPVFGTIDYPRELTEDELYRFELIKVRQ